MIHRFIDEEMLDCYARLFTLFGVLVGFLFVVTRL